MKIYSWNVLYKNKHLPEVCDFIQNLEFEVLCLQEVPVQLLDWIKKNDWNIAYGIDVREYKGTETYVVIISKLQIVSSSIFSVPIPSFSLRARITTLIMSVVQGWHQMKEKSVVSADVQIGTKKIRIFCAHLTIAGPGFRRREFQETLNRRDTKIPEIIAGDLNVVEHPFIKIYSWLLGSPLREGMPWYPERRLVEEKFKEQNLRNPLRGKITHKFSQSQLDHILVSPEFLVKEAFVVPNSHGSDHQPIGIELELVSL